MGPAEPAKGLGGEGQQAGPGAVARTEHRAPAPNSAGTAPARARAAGGRGLTGGLGAPWGPLYTSLANWRLRAQALLRTGSVAAVLKASIPGILEPHSLSFLLGPTQAHLPFQPSWPRCLPRREGCVTAGWGCLVKLLGSAEFWPAPSAND